MEKYSVLEVGKLNKIDSIFITSIFFSVTQLLLGIINFFGFDRNGLFFYLGNNVSWGIFLIVFSILSFYNIRNFVWFYLCVNVPFQFYCGSIFVVYLKYQIQTELLVLLFLIMAFLFLFSNFCLKNVRSYNK